jgi:hypothetical protein
MSWSTVREGIRQAIALAARAEDYMGADAITAVRVTDWEGQPTASRWGQAAGPTVDLRMGEVIGLHQDERRVEFISGATPALSYLKPTYTGTRLFTVRVSVDSDSQLDDADAVGPYTGALRTRMRRDDVAAILQAAGVAIVTIGNTINADFLNEDGRQQSRAVTDIRFGTTESDTDADPTGDYIQNVAGQGELVGDVGATAVDTTFDVVDDVEPTP